MALNNSLVQQNANKMVEFTAGNETVKLSPNIIRNYLVSGDSSKVTDQEIVMFLNLCRYQHLNPFLREAYLVKYGNNAATIVTGKDAFMKRAQRNDRYKGNQAGVIVITQGGQLEQRIGGLVLKGEELVGGWAKVFIDGFTEPVEVTVSFEEYVAKKSNGEVNTQWRTKPATMIRKVALVQALREAFPEDFEGMYSQEEMGVDSELLSDAPVRVPDAVATYAEDERPVVSEEPLLFEGPNIDPLEE